jgi:hypothetical protein
MLLRRRLKPSKGTGKAKSHNQRAAKGAKQSKESHSGATPPAPAPRPCRRRPATGRAPGSRPLPLLRASGPLTPRLKRRRRCCRQRNNEANRQRMNRAAAPWQTRFVRCEELVAAASRPEPLATAAASAALVICPISAAQAMQPITQLQERTALERIRPLRTSDSSIPVRSSLFPAAIASASCLNRCVPLGRQWPARSAIPLRTRNRLCSPQSHRFPRR